MAKKNLNEKNEPIDDNLFQEFKAWKQKREEMLSKAGAAIAAELKKANAPKDVVSNLISALNELLLSQKIPDAEYVSVEPDYPLVISFLACKEVDGGDGGLFNRALKLTINSINMKKTGFAFVLGMEETLGVSTSIVHKK